MSSMNDLRITVFNINSMLAELHGEAKVRIHRSYNRVRLQIDEGNTTRDTPAIGPKECSVFAEGMEQALKLLYYRKEKEK